jgi:hypothetical protein
MLYQMGPILSRYRATAEPIQLTKYQLVIKL